MFGNDRLEHRLARVERKLDLILAHLGLEDPRSVQGLAEVDALVRAGKKIEAVKKYRQVDPGAGLGEAVAAVEERARGNR
ncbi:hypothetical protein SAMN05421776_102623 [Nocardia farcinica]|uniref:Uncharacterized protein n=1 Tax=Nocardia farcinica TaxID=37329 RepID=A0A0H5NTG0_NOCFR|nr:hypothetical protein [Nocardia farcinica]AXK86236.1 hypothetical protein DXT66_11955 [Nocardia farcinica]MBA4857276.1 hypothetical protein [Nocardia farcinica]MBC9817570.1 hypothetical protein [Nocardia farcinica]MBF6232465.1 hypothetical protein [Nocardia farcinica]MBF6540358.1 hypothetical protein [Nocardia farcinica]